jgi:hypothetical protein
LSGKPGIQEVPLVKTYLSIINDAAKEIAAEEQEEAMAEKAQAMMEGTPADLGDEDGEFYEPNT